MKWLLVLPLAIVGCSSAPVDTPDYRAISSVAFAVAVLTPDDGRVPNPEPTPDKCDCGGSGYIVHGDGHRTPCPCGPSCNCGSGDAEPGESPNTQEVSKESPRISQQARQAIIFTAEWCGPCKKMYPEIEKLKKAGWKVGPEVDAQIRVLDYDANEELAKSLGIDRLPVTLGMHGGVHKATVHGPINAFQIGHVYHGEYGKVMFRQ